MILEFLLGEVRLSFGLSDKSGAFSVLSRLDVPFRGLISDSSSFSLLVPLYRKRRITENLRREGIEVTVKEIRGAPSLFYRYRKRVCIPLGLLLCALLVWLSGRVIWCVNVEGNSSVSDGEITEILDSLGCGVGDFYDEIDFDVLHNRFLMECEGIAWIAVNMNGTHANVEVREVMEGGEEEKEGFYNIVATEDGQIERIAATEGKPVVEIFDTVKKGELLISGAISYKSDTMSRFESAEGSVYARVLRTFEVKVPVEREKAAYTGEKTEKNTVRFFNFNINLFGNSRIPYEFCDTITITKQIILFESVALPLYIDKTVYKEFLPKTEILSEKEAEEIAVSLYKDKLSEVLGDAEIIEKTTEKEFDGKVFTIRCRLYCLADIAKKVPLGLSDNEKTENKYKETEKYGTENSQRTQQ